MRSWIVRQKKCKESSKRSRKNSQRRKKKKQSQDSDEYDHVKDLVSKGAADNSKEEDYSKYLIRGAQENLDDLADEILTKQDPFSFYYIMKDKHKKDKKKRTLGRSPTMGSSSSSAGGGSDSKRPQGPPPPPFKLGSMPIFIRHRGPLSTLLQTVQSYG